jgi:xanthine/uracil permease
MSWLKPTDPRVDLRQRVVGMLVFAVAAVIAPAADAPRGLTAALVGLTTGWVVVVAVKWYALRQVRRPSARSKSS